MFLICCLAGIMFPAHADQGSAPLTLGAAIAASLTHQPVIAAARARSQGAGKDEAAAAHALYPALSLEGEDLFASTTNGVPDFAAANGAREITGQIVINQPIYDARLRASVEAARANALFAHFASLRTRLAVVQACAQAFYSLRSREAGVQIWQGTLLQVQQLLTATRAGFSAGIRARLDVARAQAQVSAAQASLATAQVERDTATRLLSLMTGLDPLPPLAPPRPLSAKMSLPDPAGLRRAALLQRPDLRMAQADVMRRRAELQFAKGASWPRLSLRAAYGWDTLTTPSSRNEGWAAGLSMQVPIFEWGRLSEREAAARYRTQAAEAQRAAAVLAIDAQIGSALGDAQAALADFRASHDLVRQNADIYRMSQEGYASGRLSGLDLALARRDWVHSQLRRAQARYALRLALVELDLVTGALPTQDGGKP